ncbi:MAG: PIN domain-containing protein [Magnetococcales bacterium]|nr:PIN domain-containing protein [Magnetococcales bacterium]
MTVPVFVDTNIWVYALTGSDDRRHEQARRRLAGLGSRPVVNGQVLREVGRVLYAKSKVDEEGIRVAMNCLYDICQVVPDNRAVLLRASCLRQDYRFSYWDSLVVAAALESGCAALMSEDLQHGQVIEGILTIFNPFMQE